MKTEEEIITEIKRIQEEHDKLIRGLVLIRLM